VQPAAGDPAEQADGRGERQPVHPRDRGEQRVLHRRRDFDGELAQPPALLVAVHPLGHRRLQVVELYAAVVRAGPDVLQPLAELGVPHQRRQVVEDDGHADVVDRSVGQGADRVVGDRVAPEQPEVSRAGELDRCGQRDPRSA
jgi:hypothetical protein